MRKILVVARREFVAAVKTKTFLVGLLLMPILMGGSIVVQLLLKDVTDTRERRYAVLDRTPGASLLPVLQERIASYNKEVYSSESSKQVRPRFVLEEVRLEEDSAAGLERLRERMSERVRQGDLSGFLEIGRRVGDKPTDAERKEKPDDFVLRYQSNRITQQELKHLAENAINEELQKLRGEKAGVKDELRRELSRRVELVSRGLSRRNAEGRLEDTSEQSLLAPLFVPGGMMMLMFMVVMMVANPLLQGVVEEKMQRIAEVLLGSVRPFELMLGKLLGMTAVSLTISAVYLAGTYATAWYFGLAEYLPATLVAWFLIYQSLAGLLYGSLFIAIGAACTDMKETQNLLLPVMLLVCLPLFMLGSVLREPNSPAVTGLSFFPFATPMLMLARQAAPPGIPLWQPLTGIAVVLATTLLCVWAAGRIFRVGLLLQGKGASLREMVGWIFKG